MGLHQILCLSQTLSILVTFTMHTITLILQAIFPSNVHNWNAKTVSDLESARQKLEAFIIKETCPTLVSKGMQVMFDEWGANVNAPNAQAFVSDFINICKEQNIGSLYYDIVPASYEGTGLLNEDYLTLNAVGQTWAACMPK
jgi:hypothetical protein